MRIGNECLRWSWFKDFENSFLQMIADDVGVWRRVYRFKFVFLAELANSASSAA